MTWGGGARGAPNLKQAPDSELSVSPEPDMGLELKNQEIMT